jgi:hypothetical protein
MQVGVAFPHHAIGSDPGLRDWAQAAKDLGFDRPGMGDWAQAGMGGGVRWCCRRALTAQAAESQLPCLLGCNQDSGHRLGTPVSNPTPRSRDPTGRAWPEALSRPG